MTKQQITLTKGNNNDILSSDAEEVRNEINSVNFLINSNSATYSEEFLTTSYINNLFLGFKEAEDYWKQIIQIVKQYHDKIEAIPLPDSPVDVNSINDLTDDDNELLSLNDDNVKYQGIVNIKSGTLNFRSSPNGEIIGNISKGSKVNIIEKSPTSKWIKVEINGQEGFIYDEYLNINESINSIKENEKKAFVNINDGSLNVRLTPNGEIIGSLKKGNEVKILDDTNENWIKVEVNGLEGFVHKDYLSNNKIINSSNNYGVVNINDGSLNVRLTPNGEIIGSLEKGSKIEILDNISNQNWTKIRIDGKEAYVYSKYIKM